jgi:hypothetical protein
MLKEADTAQCNVLSRYLLEVQRKPTKYLSRDSRSSGRYLNSGPTEYESGVLTIQPWRSVSGVFNERENIHAKKTETLYYNVI